MPSDGRRRGRRAGRIDPSHDRSGEPAASRSASGEIAQLVEHTTENRGVPGSNPGLAIQFLPANRLYLSRASWAPPAVALDHVVPLVVQNPRFMPSLRSLWLGTMSRRALEIGLVVRFLRGKPWHKSLGTRAGIVIPSVRFLGLHPRPSVEARGRAVVLAHYPSQWSQTRRHLDAPVLGKPRGPRRPPRASWPAERSCCGYSDALAPMYGRSRPLAEVLVVGHLGFTVKSVFKYRDRMA
jgi:hypothetical protein